MNEIDIREKVREHYAGIAEGKTSCCSGTSARGGDEKKKFGYSPEELEALPDQSETGLGCGNPLSFAILRPGEVVVDLGSGGGIDCFLASKKVGPAGSVIGVDMTSQMLAKARRNADSGGYANVEFRLPLVSAHWAIVKGWAEPHYLQSFGLMPTGTVIVYTPRNREELEVCYSLFFESYYFACRFGREKAVQASRPELPDTKIAEQSGRVDLAGGDLQATGCRNNRKAVA
jgi:hypothetical protein